MTKRAVVVSESGSHSTVTSYLHDFQAPAVEKQVRSKLRELAKQLGMSESFSLSLCEVAEEDWLGQWRQSYLPVRAGRRVVVKPSWHRWPPKDSQLAAFDDDIVVEIDPQMAFGTGHHSTTQLCLQALEDLVYPHCQVADVGCGSGILSIVAAKLGAACVLAIDNDLVAAQIAQESIRHNSVAEQVKVMVGDSLTAVSQSFDIIVANINTPTVVRLSGALARQTAPGGWVVVSGIPTVRGQRVASALRQAGLWVEQRRTKESWVCIAAQRRTNASSP